MARVKIKFPDDKPLYHCTIPVRIGDINYGGHAGNDSLLSIIHEARVQMLAHWGWTELDAGGNSLIMADVMIAYRGEAFYGEVLHVTLFADEVTTQSFDLLYKITTSKDGQPREILHAKTGMVCFDYQTRKIAGMEHQLRERLNNATA
ncbi:MAG: thioesterase family protein [Taibaiella sp.]|nr:thioesterase family protein [Taibaiella sp.]